MRLFFAVHPSEEIRRKAAALADEIKAGCENLDAKWVPPENFHITLVFLGETPETKLAELKNVAQQAAKTGKSFSAEFGNLGVFPNTRAPRVLWIGISKGAQELRHLARGLHHELQAGGFLFDSKDPDPHLTLARMRDPREPSRAKVLSSAVSKIRGYVERPMPALGSWPVLQIALMESLLAKPSPIYKTLEQFNLGHE
ncbi:MAG: RNA 2',3'-cyclic phosphodiesterase [Elusimicrobia bacterium]|nr:RNA 2',3'-cyclic phosphodiesterase [Elusimicrobiota bacterium]